MTKLSLPSDFAKLIAETLSMTDQGVEEYFDVSEDKEGFFWAKLKPKKFLDTSQFKAMCALARGLGGEGYLMGAKAWTIPGPCVKVSPQAKAPLPSASKPSDARSISDQLKFDKSKPPYFTVPINALLSMPFQSRLVAEDANLAELVESIKAYGVLEPIIVRTMPDGLYEIVAGERRVRAAQKAGLIEIPANIKMLNDEEASIIQFTENSQRKDYSEEEKSRALGELARRFGWSAQQIADKLKMSYTWVTKYLPSEFKDKEMASLGKLGGEAKAEVERVITEGAIKESATQRVAEESPKFVQCGRCGIGTSAPVHLNGKFYCESCAQKIESDMGQSHVPITPRTQTLAVPPKEVPIKVPEPEPLDFAEVTCPICKETFRLVHHGHRDHRAEYYAEAEDE
jgi:ParB/RepB/Spo0J family partition protein